MQRAHVAEERFGAARRRCERRAGVRIHVALLSRRERHPNSLGRLANDAQRRDALLRLARRNSCEQIGRSERRPTIRFDLSAIARERRDDLLFERQHRARGADEGKHDAHRDADDPVQLEQDFAWRHQTSAQLRSRL